MSVKKLSGMLGAKVLVRDGTISYQCVIKDIKEAYGSTLYLVEPVKGNGEKWVKDFIYTHIAAED